MWLVNLNHVTNCGAHFLSPPSVFETAAFEREFVTVLSWPPSWFNGFHKSFAKLTLASSIRLIWPRLFIQYHHGEYLLQFWPHFSLIFDASFPAFGGWPTIKKIPRIRIKMGVTFPYKVDLFFKLISFLAWMYLCTCRPSWLPNR